MSKKEPVKTPAVLIVGDWVIDKYWLLVRHQSEISSHTGFNHYRLSNRRDDVIADLCGAGHVARSLYQLRGADGGAYKIYGLGHWNEGDSSLIAHLVHAREKGDCRAASACFHLTPTFCSEPPDVNLITLQPDGPTISVVRQYHLEDGKARQISRVDWEPQVLPQGGRRSLNRSRLPQNGQLRAIIVHDLAKGVVNAEMIKTLHQMYPKARWYVRSKIRNPPWLNTIKDALELLLIGPELATLLNPWETWLADGRITARALEILDEFKVGRNIVLLSERREMIARADSSALCVTGRSAMAPTAMSQLGWSSALFASLFHVMFERQSALRQEDFVRALTLADGLGTIPAPSTNGKPTRDAPQPTVRVQSWETESHQWQQATEECGVIDDGGQRLEVWRGATHLPGYVACIREKQKIITRIGQGLRAFSQNGSPPRSLSIMLQADPGAGKTFLAKSLASAFDFSFVRYDVTQMINRAELLDLFDTVATMQASDDRKVLVFVDEINSLLDGNHVYGAFLTPLEEGVYVRRGKYFSLKPCVWVFAGTGDDDLKRTDDDRRGAADKLPDFISRMTMTERIDYKSLKKLYGRNTSQIQDEARLEQVYLGATMIRRHFPDVQEVTREVLERFHAIDPEGESPARTIRKLAASLRNVQYGKVSKENCAAWEEIVDWPVRTSKDGAQFVKLIFG